MTREVTRRPIKTHHICHAPTQQFVTPLQIVCHAPHSRLSRPDKWSVTPPHSSLSRPYQWSVTPPHNSLLRPYILFDCFEPPCTHVICTDEDVANKEAAYAPTNVRLKTHVSPFTFWVKGGYGHVPLMKFLCAVAC